MLCIPVQNGVVLGFPVVVGHQNIPTATIATQIRKPTQAAMWSIYLPSALAMAATARSVLSQQYLRPGLGDKLLALS